MTDIVVDSKFSIRKELVPLTWRVVMRGELTFTSKQFANYVGGNVGYSVCLYEEYDDIIKVPVKYGFTKFSYKIENGEYTVCDNRPKSLFQFEFRDDLWMKNQVYYRRQKECIDTIIPILCNSLSHSGMIYLTTGAGKTAIAIKAMSILGGPVLVLLHRELLLTQWFLEIRKWLNISDSDIGIVQQNLFGGYKKIVLASIQTLLERQYDRDFYNRFSFIISDEAHHVASECFSKVIPMFNARYKLGLLGQPRRSDGMDGVYLQEIGDIIYANTENIYDADFYILNCDSYFDSKWFTFKTRDGNKISLQKLLNMICKDYKYREAIVRLLKNIIAQNKKVVVLSHRVEFCKFLYLSLLTYCEMVKKKIGIAVSDMRQDVKSCDVVISTYQMLGEGIDLKDHDTIVLATPTANLNQAVGRILRGNKQKVNIIVIKFPINEISHWYDRHRKMARYRHWVIKEGFLSSNLVL